MDILFQGIRIIDPAERMDLVSDLLVRDGFVAEVSPTIPPEGCRVYPGAGKVLVPGLVDMHVHLREPGQEHKETIRTGLQAAARGGFTAVAAMPNTSPPLDTPEAIESQRDRAREFPVALLPVGCVTKGQAGQELADLSGMAGAGAVAFSDDGRPVMDSALMARAMRTAAGLGRVVIDHCEDVSLSSGGVINRGEVSRRLELPGIPRAAEDIMTARDIMLAREFGLPVHLAHVSTRTSVSLIRQAKAEGLMVTAEATPHHFTLTEDALLGGDPHAKVNPPLRTREDRDAVRDGIADGTIDMIATDHAPHAAPEKAVGLREAPMGLIGLETCLGLVLTELVHPGLLPLSRAVAMLTSRPAEVFGLSRARIRPGQPADLTVIDPELRWTVQEQELASRSRNTPFFGRELTGRAVLTIAGGVLAMDGGRLLF